MIRPFKSNSDYNDFIEIMDTTLRDGEQTEEVSFSSSEKLAIAKKLLLDVKVDRIEIASTRVSKGEEESCKLIFDWANKLNMLDRIEVLSFVDFNKSIDWVDSLGGRVINLLCKGSKNHCLNQLHKKPREHCFDIERTVKYAKKKNFLVNAYLEDFSNGIKEDKNYVFLITKKLLSLGVNRIMLADTLGVLSPEDVKKNILKMTRRFPGAKFDFHAHNDYGLSIANSLFAVNSGVRGIHVTVNGLGERTGNTPLEVFVPVLKDFTRFNTNVDEKQLSNISHLVELFSRRRIEKNHPVVGGVVFTQTAGIHADGDKKGNLYKSKLFAQRFGRLTRYSLGKLSGKASIDLTLKQFGIKLNENELKKVLEKVIEFGDKKEFVSRDDLLFILNELQQNKSAKKFEVLNYKVTSSKTMTPNAKIKVIFNSKKFSSFSNGGGGFDAFINALKKIFEENNLSFPQLIDYEVRIPVGGHTDALVECKIIWKKGNRRIETIGVSTDQLEAAIKATEKMVNVVLFIK